MDHNPPDVRPDVTRGCDPDRHNGSGERSVTSQTRTGAERTGRRDGDAGIQAAPHALPHTAPLRH